LLEDGTWTYSNSKSTLEATGLLNVKDYNNKQNNMVRNYIEHTEICNECINTTLSPRNSAQIVWWQESEENE
jgi:hypothetical protein